MTRHPLDLFSLLCGLVLLAVAAVYAGADASGRTPALQVVLPLMVVGLGIAGLVAAVAAQRRSDTVRAAAVAERSDADAGRSRSDLGGPAFSGAETPKSATGTMDSASGTPDSGMPGSGAV